MATPTLGRGQIWHVQPPGTIIGAPGSTFSIQEITPPADGAPAVIQIYRWTLEALQVSRGTSISLPQDPQLISGTLIDHFPPGQEVRRLQVTSLLNKQQLLARKDSRASRKSSFIKSVTGSPTPSLQVQSVRSTTNYLPAPPRPCDIYVGHHHGPTMIQDQLNARPAPMMGSIAYYSAGE